MVTLGLGLATEDEPSELHVYLLAHITVPYSESGKFVVKIFS